MSISPDHVRWNSGILHRDTSSPESITLMLHGRCSAKALVSHLYIPYHSMFFLLLVSWMFATWYPLISAFFALCCQTGNTSVFFSQAAGPLSRCLQLLRFALHRFSHCEVAFRAGWATLRCKSKIEWGCVFYHRTLHIAINHCPFRKGRDPASVWQQGHRGKLLQCPRFTIRSAAECPAMSKSFSQWGRASHSVWFSA